MTQEIWFKKYRIIKSLAGESKSNVYLAEHILLNSYRVIKFIPKEHPLYEARQNEAYILKSLFHPSIPIVYDIEKDKYGSYIIEEYLEGLTLKEYVNKEGKLREETILGFSMQICDLIQYIHSIKRPLLYLDLKPDNIIISKDAVKLIDFDSAVYLDEVHKKKSFYSTKGYAAPELYGRNKVDERSDVYGIGMLLYYMVTGQYFKADISEIDNIDASRNCSKRLKKIINRCLKVNPSQRYPCVSRISRELSSIRRKVTLVNESSQPIQYAVAGVQARIGTSHLCFRLSTYLSSYESKCLYKENNNSNCVRKIRKRYGYIERKEGLLQIGSIPMVPYEDKEEGHIHKIKQYDFIVHDFGCLTKDNLSAFLSADVKLLLLGAKDWELEYAERVLEMVTEYEDIIYLFNYLDGKMFQQAMKSMEHRHCYRIPYNPDPFSKSFSASEHCFYKGIGGQDGQKANAFSKIKRRW